MDVAREVATAPNGLNALAQVLCYILEVNDHVEREALQALLAGVVATRIALAADCPAQ